MLFLLLDNAFNKSSSLSLFSKFRKIIKFNFFFGYFVFKKIINPLGILTTYQNNLRGLSFYINIRKNPNRFVTGALKEGVRQLQLLQISIKYLNILFIFSSILYKLSG